MLDRIRIISSFHKFASFLFSDQATFMDKYLPCLPCLFHLLICAAPFGPEKFLPIPVRQIMRKPFHHGVFVALNRLRALGAWYRTLRTIGASPCARHPLLGAARLDRLGDSWRRHPDTAEMMPESRRPLDLSLPEGLLLRNILSLNRRGRERGSDRLCSSLRSRRVNSLGQGSDSLRGRRIPR